MELLYVLGILSSRKDGEVSKVRLIFFLLMFVIITHGPCLYVMVNH
jgi:hypothetical protein